MSETEDKSPVIVGSDHAAFQLKEIILKDLKKRGIPAEDAGPPNEDSVDYPDFGAKVAGAVSEGKFERGILLCGTGIGMSIVANKFPGVRAALCNDLFSAFMCKQHNNANILVMGGRVVGDILALKILDAWLETPFEGGRHQHRLDKIEQIPGIRPVS